jgi:hypothetical protein
MNLRPLKRLSGGVYRTRDGFFGLLAPPTEERRAELDVKVRECG